MRPYTIRFPDKTCPKCAGAGEHKILINPVMTYCHVNRAIGLVKGQMPMIQVWKGCNQCRAKGVLGADRVGVEN